MHTHKLNACHRIGRILNHVDGLSSLCVQDVDGIVARRSPHIYADKLHKVDSALCGEPTLECQHRIGNDLYNVRLRPVSI